MIDIAGGADDHLVADVVAFHVVADGVGRKRLHRVDGAQNAAADRLRRKRGFLEQIEDVIVGIVAGRANLLDDDLLLAVELGLVEQRILEDVGEDVAGERHVLLEDAGEVAGVFHRGRRVEVAADIFDGCGDIERGARFGALERHVLEDMRNAVLGFGFAARTGLYPDAERSAFEMRHVIGDDSHAIVEGR